ncbi:hypothetical protein MRX96_057833 [Rhipicephalus microplus]
MLAILAVAVPPPRSRVRKPNIISHLGRTLLRKQHEPGKPKCPDAPPAGTTQRTRQRRCAGALCDARCNAPRNAANSAGARFAETTTIDSDSPDQLDCMDAGDFQPMDNVGHSGSTPGSCGVAEASNNTYLWPSVPHTPWFRVIEARRTKVFAEEAFTMQPATFHQREHRHGTGRPCLPRFAIEDQKERRFGNCGILNPSEHHGGCVPRCVTCGSDENPTIDLGCPARLDPCSER